MPDASSGCDPAADAEQRLHAGRVFAISGASGGSVGAYAYARELQANGCLRPGWYARWFARDLVGPTIGWGLAHDLPGVLLHQRPASDGDCTFDVDTLSATRCRIAAASSRTPSTPIRRPASSACAATSTPTRGPCRTSSSTRRPTTCGGA